MKIASLNAAILVALLAGCAATTDAPGSASAPAASPTDAFPSPAAEASASPSAVTSEPAPEPPIITWSEVPFDGPIRDAIGDGERFVMVGEGIDGSAAWTSSDGVTWEEHAVPDRAVAEPNPGITVDALMGHLVRLGDTLYSFGGQVFIDTPYLVVWRWTDGDAWQVVESESEFFAAGGFVRAVGAGDEALLVAKSYPYSPGTSPWRWTAESSWEQGSLEPAGGHALTVVDFAWAGGIYVAVGLAADPQDGVDPAEWSSHPAILTSSDGMTWTTVTAPDGASGLCDVTALPDGGFVALGSAADRIAAWNSLDGMTWTESSIEDADVIGMPVESCQVVAVEGGLLAGVGTAVEPMATWTSTDGRAWTSGEALEALGTLASIGDRVLLVGAAQERASQVVLVGAVEP